MSFLAGKRQERLFFRLVLPSTEYIAGSFETARTNKTGPMDEIYGHGRRTEVFACTFISAGARVCERYAKQVPRRNSRYNLIACLEIATSRRDVVKSPIKL